MNPVYGIICGGLITFVIVCLRLPPPPCPKISWKCWVVLVIGAGGAALYYSILGFRNPITSMDFIAGNLAAVALGGFVYRLLCPLK